MAVAVQRGEEAIPNIDMTCKDTVNESEVIPRKPNTFVIGSRNSKLAMVQSEHIKKLIEEAHPELDVHIVSMTTLGDRVLNQPLYSFGGKALWTKDLEVAMLTGNVDAIVHSLKDLPTVFPEGCALGCVAAREDPTDALVVRKGLSYKTLDDLPEGAVVGTSSVRRVAQLRHFYPKLHFADMRGNLHTRLRKLDEDESIYSALILATAGLNRLGLDDRITCRIDHPTLHYAVGQGALGIEIRDGDAKTASIVKSIDCYETRLRTSAERGLLHALEGGCSVPVGCRTVITPIQGENAYNLHLTGTVTSPVCQRHVVHSEEVKVATEEDAVNLGFLVASHLVKNGARNILEELGRHVANMKIANHNIHPEQPQPQQDQPEAPQVPQEEEKPRVAPHPLPPGMDPTVCLRPQGW